MSDIFERFGDYSIQFKSPDNDIIVLPVTLRELYNTIEEKILKSDKLYQSFKERLISELDLPDFIEQTERLSNTCEKLEKRLNDPS